MTKSLNSNPFEFEFFLLNTYYHVTFNLNLRGSVTFQLKLELLTVDQHIVQLKECLQSALEDLEDMLRELADMPTEKDDELPTTPVEKELKGMLLELSVELLARAVQLENPLE